MDYLMGMPILVLHAAASWPPSTLSSRKGGKTVSATSRLFDFCNDWKGLLLKCCASCACPCFVLILMVLSA